MIRGSPLFSLNLTKGCHSRGGDCTVVDFAAILQFTYLAPTVTSEASPISWSVFVGFY